MCTQQLTVSLLSLSLRTKQKTLIMTRFPQPAIIIRSFNLLVVYHYCCCFKTLEMTATIDRVYIKSRHDMQKLVLSMFENNNCENVLLPQSE